MLALFSKLGGIPLKSYIRTRKSETALFWLNPASIIEKCTRDSPDEV